MHKIGFFFPVPSRSRAPLPLLSEPTPFDKGGGAHIWHQGRFWLTIYSLLSRFRLLAGAVLIAFMPLLRDYFHDPAF